MYFLNEQQHKLEPCNTKEDGEMAALLVCSVVARTSLCALDRRAPRPQSVVPTTKATDAHRWSTVHTNNLTVANKGTFWSGY